MVVLFGEIVVSLFSVRCAEYACAFSQVFWGLFQSFVLVIPRTICLSASSIAPIFPKSCPSDSFPQDTCSSLPRQRDGVPDGLGSEVSRIIKVWRAGRSSEGTNASPLASGRSLVSFSVPPIRSTLSAVVRLNTWRYFEAPASRRCLVGRLGDVVLASVNAKDGFARSRSGGTPVIQLEFAIF